MKNLIIIAALFVFMIYAGFFLYRSGYLRLNHPSPAKYPISGVDVSHHQGAIDWSRVAASGVAFAFIKATEGRDHVDRLFASNWQESRSAGIPRGAYHFFTFCTPGLEQADNFLRVVPPEPDALPPAVDVEFAGNCVSWSDLDQIREELSKFLARVEEVWGTKVIVYVNDASFEKIVRYELKGRPLWVRNIMWEPAPDAYGSWQIWQFSENSRVPGIDGLVDRNVLGIEAGLTGLRMPVAPVDDQ